MPTLERTPSLTPSGVRPIHGIESVNDAVKGGHLDHFQLGRGVMTGTLGYLSLGTGVLGFGRADLAVHTRGCFNPTGQAIGVLLDMPQRGRFWGAEGQAGSIVLAPPGAEADATVFGSQTYAYLLLAYPIWERAVASLAPGEASLKKTRGLVNPPAALTRRLMKRIVSLIGLVTNGCGLPAGAAVTANEELQALIIHAATAGTPLTEPCGRFFEHQRIVRRAEDFLQDRIERDVYMREVCDHCDVSERTLQYAFREILGITPTAYLRRRRLSAIRRELVAPGPPPSVGRTALRWGFWHLGEFAAAYRAFFGESPVETVRRRV